MVPVTARSSSVSSSVIGLWMPVRKGCSTSCGMRLRLKSATTSMPFITVPRIAFSIVLAIPASSSKLTMFTYDSKVTVSTLESTSEKKSYHHGDLRAALIEAGLTLLETRAADDLGLREVARTVGVSPTAIYRHFPDKRALMVALASEGLARLAAGQHAASEAKGGGGAGFSATGATYVRFARDNPALFRLIFANSKSGDLMDGQPEDAAFAFLRAN